MVRKSTIKTLPPNIKRMADLLIRQDEKTQLEMVDMINARLEEIGGDPVSKSAFNRYAKSMTEAGRRIRQTREIAAVWVRELGEMPEGDVGKLLAELVRTLAFDAASAISDGDTPAVPAQVMALARAVKDLEHADTLSVQREIAIRKEERERAAAKLDGALEEAAAAGEPGLSPERVAQLRRDFLGVRPETEKLSKKQSEKRPAK
tara:strand:+ start:99 stop:713 length:615 start_codon:yes stop_codon:yes gene_type:complete